MDRVLTPEQRKAARHRTAAWQAARRPPTDARAGQPCECGCAHDAGVYQRTDTSRGRVAGQPRRFIKGHQLRRSTYFAKGGAKRCRRCEAIRLVESFHRMRKSPDGRHPVCKTCRHEESAAHYAADPEAVATSWARWAAKNPQRAKEAARQRCAVRRGRLDPTVDTQEYDRLLRADPCSYCGARGEEVDHIDAVSQGGSGAWANLTATCSRCNRRKGTHRLLAFLTSGLTG